MRRYALFVFNISRNFETIYSSFIVKYTSITFVFVWANKFSPYHFGIFSATKNHVKFYSHIYCFRTYDGYKSCVYNATVFLFSAEIYTQIQTGTHIYTNVYLYIRPKHTPRSQLFFSSVLCVTSRAPYSCRGLYSCDSVSVGTHIHTFTHARILLFSTHANRCCAYISLYSLRPLKIV